MALRPDQTTPPQSPKTPRQPGSWLRLALLAGLSLYIVILLSPVLSRFGGPARVDLSYSQLLTQIDSGNVADITIQGQNAQGDLKSSFTNNGVTNTQFSATVPDNVGLTDPTFFPLLKSNHVTTVVKQDTGGIASLLFTFLPFLVLIAIWIWFVRRSGQAAQGIFSFGRSRARMQEPGTPKTTFHDVAGVEQAQFELQEMVDFLRDPQKFQKLGGRMPKGVLLIGPPGTGKTLLAKAVAGEAGVPFFSISASEFVEMFVGVGASRVRDLFNQARQSAPCVIFIDEIDAVGRKRSMRIAGNDERDQTLNQLLVELDGFDGRKAVVVLAATNRVDILDKALLRPGRFDRHVTVSHPDRVGREAILKVHTRLTPLHEDVSLERLSRLTIGMTGADLANLVNEAALCAARQDLEHITHDCFEDALVRVQLGALRRIVMSEKDRHITAYHEAGHALVAYHLPEADSVNRVTILPRGQSLGVTQFTAEEDRYNYSRETLMARIAVGLGGRVAEELTFGAERVTTGAENDLQVVTDLARRMVTRWGMSEQVGVVFADYEPGGMSLNMRRSGIDDLPAQGRSLLVDADGRLILNSGDAGDAGDMDDVLPRQHVFAMGMPAMRNTNNSATMASMIDLEVQRILKEGYAMARTLLSEHDDQLKKLANTLMELEQLNRKQFEALLQE